MLTATKLSTEEAFKLYKAAEGMARCTGSVECTYSDGVHAVKWNRRDEDAPAKHRAREER